MDTVGKAAVGPSELAKPTINLKRMLGDWGPVVLLTLGSLWLIQGALARTAWHGVIVQGANYDAGAVKAGATITHKIRLINLSALPVTVDAQPSCGCTMIDVPKNPVYPMHTCLLTEKVEVRNVTVYKQTEAARLLLQTRERSWTGMSTVSFLSR